VEEPIWLTAQVVEIIHLGQLAEHGGRRGVHDRNALESAVARCRQRLTHDPEATLQELAVALCHGLVRDHPFIDGNKRVGFLAAYAFLGLNGFELEAAEDDVVSTIEGVAAGSVSETGLADWFEARSQRIG
jgi:death-on-curing protein